MTGDGLMDLFIGSTNKSKIDFWKKSLIFVKIATPTDLNISLDVYEGMQSLRENAERKAIEWAQASGKVTLADDTGFFIEALDGKPGVSVKRWAGEFEKEMTNTELLQYIEKVMGGVENTRAYFETVYAIAKPDGTMISFSQKYPGFIDLSKLNSAYTAGYPLGAIFVEDSHGKTWMDMTDEDQKESTEALTVKIQSVLNFFR
jgi:XTP/dITP diphosphohydrolase